MQGVFFRATAKEEAEKINISGFARNELDGTVYIEVEGEEKNLEKFLSWCKKGPKEAVVKKIEVSEDPVKNIPGFGIDFEDYN